MSNSIRFHYLRDANRNPVSCIAILFDKGTKKAAFAMSTLNPSDDFNRKVAQDLAVGRLIRHPFKLDLSNEEEEITCHLITQKIFEQLWKSELPSRARTSIKKWMVENGYGFEFEKNGINPLTIIDNLTGIKHTLA